MASCICRKPGARHPSFSAPQPFIPLQGVDLLWYVPTIYPDKVSLSVWQASEIDASLLTSVSTVLSIEPSINGVEGLSNGERPRLEQLNFPGTSADDLLACMGGDYSVFDAYMYAFPPL